MGKIKDFFKKLSQKRETKIHKRIKNLWLYNELFDINTEKLHTLEKDTGEVLLEFNSNWGTVRIHIDLWGWDYDDIRLEYYNYAGLTVFKIISHYNWTPDIQPMLGEDITAEDIDLALLELEEYLSNTYGDIEVLWKEHLEYEKNRAKLHKEQVKELE